MDLDTLESAAMFGMTGQLMFSGYLLVYGVYMLLRGMKKKDTTYRAMGYGIIVFSLVMMIQGLTTAAIFFAVFP